ncbi:helix-turn-helix transcriptional regulator [Anaerococcus sp. mt242]|nr:AraC family transcriptional regulator [Anaerococcus sp. mt242]MBM0045868.1 helix-turn-helix transcriptional regulator [Anaerococcus sp. mt242]
MENTNFRDIEHENDISNVDIKVLDAQRNNYTRNYSSRIQFHPFTYFYFVNKGFGKLSIENETISIHQKDIIVINSNIGHTIYIDGSCGECEILGFGVESLSFSKVNRMKSNIEPINFFSANIEEDKIDASYFDEIYDEFHSDQIFSKAMANSKAAIFIVELLRKFENQITVKHDRKVNRQVDYIKNYIDSNYAEDIKLEQLSAMAYMNKFHLISEFKQSYRVTPIEYLILKRIEISKNLLISTNHSMEEISSIVGFNSQSYFNQVFKKKVGQTPSQFRKKHRL